MISFTISMYTFTLMQLLNSSNKLTYRPESSAEEFDIPAGIWKSSFITEWHYVTKFLW